MNKNKGIIGIGLIIAIVLGIVIVGGGAYYLGNSNSKKEVNNPVVNVEENLPSEEDQKTNINPKVVSDCDSNSKPSIKVLSPNGGEVYQAGQQITVKWKSCNVAENKQLRIDLSESVSGGAHTTSVPIIKNTPNDGSETFVLDNTVYDYFGKTDGYPFKIYIVDSCSGSGCIAPSDYSDNTFTINSATKTISTTNWKTYTSTGCDYSFQYPNSWSQSGNESNAINLQGNIMGRSVDFIDTASQGVETLDGSNNQIYAPKDHMHVDCYTMGTAVYNDELSRYNNSQDLFAQTKKTINVAGQTAIVGEMRDTATVSSGEHAGRTVIPSHRMYVFFLHKDQTRALYFEFDTPLNGNDTTEITNFEKLLTTFKFN